MFKVFKTPQHKEFTYTPRYYDEREEKLAQKVKDLERKTDNLSERDRAIRADQMKEKISENWVRKDYKAMKRRSAMSMVVILGFLAIILYYLYTNLDKFFD